MKQLVVEVVVDDDAVERQPKQQQLQLVPSLSPLLQLDQGNSW